MERERLVGYGHAPLFVEGSEPEAMADALDTAVGEIHRVLEAARDGAGATRPRWPMIVLRTPKGWTGPKEVDGLPAEGSFRSHQVPLAAVRTNPAHLAQLEEWMRSYRPEELFDERGALRDELRQLAPTGERRMGANPHANGGLLTRDRGPARPSAGHGPGARAAAAPAADGRLVVNASNAESARVLTAADLETIEDRDLAEV